MSNIVTIPEGSVEIQPGLWAYLREYTIGGQPRQRYLLYSAEGFQFYNLTVGENFDEEGNLKPLEELVYSTYASLPTAITTFEQIDEIIKSVPTTDN